MKTLKKGFFRLQDREQKLLTFAVFVVLLVALFKLVQNGAEEFQSFQTTNQLIESHEMILHLKPAIDQALEEQKIAQQNKSETDGNP